MIGTARPAPFFTKLVDRFSPIPSDLAVDLKNAGVAAVGRYLENLTAPERDGLFAAGLAILPLSVAPAGPLNGTIGHTRAGNLLEFAATLGVPLGVHLMIDLEAQQGGRTDIISYDSALSGAIARAGYISLAYVGQPQILSGADLFALPDVHLYWRGGSLGVAEPGCGFALWQIPPLEQSVAGATVDVNVTGADLRGRRPILWYPS